MEEFGTSGLFVDNTFQRFSTGHTIRLANGEQRVLTIAEGLAGFSPGSGEVTISIQYAVPAAKPEFNYHNACLERSRHTLQIGFGGVDYIGQGKFLDNEVTHSVDSAIAGTVNWTGELAAME